MVSVKRFVLSLHSSYFSIAAMKINHLVAGAPFLALAHAQTSSTTAPAAGTQSPTPTYIESTVPTGTPVPGNYTGLLRPQVHFSPPQNFMNDPNGMFVDANGTWHLCRS